MFIAVFFSACTGVETTKKKSEAGDNSVAMSGLVVDGYISGAIVCIDNGQGECDTNYPFAFSDENGQYELNNVNTVDLPSNIIIISQGGIDTSTLKQIKGSIKTAIKKPDTSVNVTAVVISPVTTFIAQKVGSGKSLDEASAEVASLIDLPSSKIFANPMQDKELFLKTQQVVQTKEIIASLVSKNSTTSLSDEELEQIVLESMISAQSLESSKIIEEVQKNTQVGTIPQNQIEFAQQSIQKVEEELEALKNDASVVLDDLGDLQKKLDESVDQIEEKIEQADDNTTIEETNTSIRPQINHAPVFVSGDQFSTVENEIFGVILEASDEDNDTLSFSIEGTDKEYFDINSSSAELRLKTVPDYETRSSYTLIVKVSDSQEETSQTLTIDITDVEDDPPVFLSDNNVSVEENQKLALILKTDSSASLKVTYSLKGEDAALLEVDEDIGIVSFKALSDYESKALYSFTAVADNGLHTVEQLVLVYITNSNDNLPVFTNSASVTVDENSMDEVFKLEATDLDNDTITYTLSRDDAQYFTLDSSSGVITFKEEPDYETKKSYSFMAEASDGLNTVYQALSVTLNNINDNKPEFFNVDAQNVVLENELKALQLYAEDNDSDVLTYTIYGFDSDYFSLNTSSGEVYFKSAPDFESNKTRYSFVAVVSDGTFDDSLGITLTVSNDNDNKPYFSTVSSIHVDENELDVIDLEALDEDGDVLRYAIKNTLDHDAFEINASLGTVYFISPPDYENNDTPYQFIAIADDGVHSVEQLITVYINNINDNAPYFAEGYNTLIELDENRSHTIVLGALDDDNDDLNYTLSGVDADYFDFNTTYPYLQFKTVPDYESNKTSYFINLFASDGRYETNQSFEIRINNINDNIPYWINISDMDIYQVYENETNITTLQVLDDDNDTLTYGIYDINGTDYNSFELNQSTGLLTFKTAPDFESNKTLYTLSVYAEDSVHELNATLFFDVLNKPDVPAVISAPESFSVSRNSAYPEVIGEITIEDSGDSTVTDFNISGELNHKFSISSSGTVTVSQNEILDDNVSQYRLKVSAWSAAGSSNAVDVNITLEEAVLRPFQIAKIKSPASEEYGYFGSVDISNDYFIVGAYGENNYTGSAYVYKKEDNHTVSFITKLGHEDLKPRDEFGASVAIEERTIFIGAPYCDNTDENISDAGCVYRFELESNGSVSFVEKLFSPSSSTYAEYGRFCTLKESDLLIHSYYETYLYEVNQTAIRSAGQLYGHYGADVSESYVVAGNPWSSSNSGSTSVYKREDNGSLTLFEEISSGVENDYFGAAVSIQDNYVLIGSPYSSEFGSYKGRVDLYKIEENESIELIHTFQPGDEDYIFGYSLKIQEGWILISSEEFDAWNYKVHMYTLDQNDSVDYIHTLKAHDHAYGDSFGYNLAVDGSHILFGAPNKDDKSVNDGAAYLFDTVPLNKLYTYTAQMNFTLPENYDQSLDVRSALSAYADEIVYSLNGEDTSYFSLQSDNKLVFNTLPDYEVPLDNGGDNNYTLQLNISDNLNHEAVIDIYINIFDRYYMHTDTIFNGLYYDGYGAQAAMDSQYIVTAVDEQIDEDLVRNSYLYKKEADTLVQIARLESNASNTSSYGSSVDIEGDYIIVGAQDDEVNGTASGSAYLFKRNSDTYNDVSWLTRLYPEDNASDDDFGNSVSISGDYIAIGAKSKHTTVPYDGSVYVYKRTSDEINATTLIATLTSPDSEESSYFGYSVSISGDYILVGEPYREMNTTYDAGAAYVFKRHSDESNQTLLIAAIQAQDLAAYDNFGLSVSIENNYFAVGAPGDDGGGAAYIYKINSDNTNDVTLLKKLKIDKKYSADFGASVRIDGNYVAVGSPYINSRNIRAAGGAYVYKINPLNEFDIQLIDQIVIDDPDENYNRYGRCLDIEHERDRVIMGGGISKILIYETDANQAE
jgi:hypothetical protein